MTVTPEQTARALMRRFDLQLRAREHMLARARAEIERLVPAIASRHGARRAFLFGSLAWGGADERSDIDVALEGVAVEKRTSAAAELMMELPLPVDVVTLEEVSESFRKRIIDEGMLLYQARP